ncbi:MAG: acyl-CoA synthetase FdrA [Kiloniellales bacterium]|nr:acyl-CoA synthetase FdrA [Kiloniellales bacterium]
MSVVINEVRKGFYLDSVALMRFSRSIAEMDGVEEAALMMATPSNREIMAQAGLLNAEGDGAGGGDLVVAIRAATEEAGSIALVQALGLLEQRRAPDGGSAAWHPRSLRAAAEAMPDANLALISVPGAFAVAEARKALRRGLHVMIFSDNVAISEEAALKREARERGLLVMGPDCGTAILNGVPLAFANVVPRGEIGIIGASGTGVQEVSCLIAQGGGGISQAIGVGGRDLKEEVGGITTLMALDLLGQDPETRHIVVVSKPPAPSVAAQVLDRLQAQGKSFTICFIGAEQEESPAGGRLVTTLKAAAEDALGVEASGFEMAPPVRPGVGGNRLRGLFSGGTLCAEAQSILRASGETVASNAPIPGVSDTAAAESGHLLLDLGSDEYTQGRPHPMIAPSVRDEALSEALLDPRIGVILLDLVIGYGAHDDPAGHLIASLKDRPDAGPAIVASVTGTDADPQGRQGQVAKLEAAGVLVAPSNADAAALALACLKRAG